MILGGIVQGAAWEKRFYVGTARIPIVRIESRIDIRNLLDLHIIRRFASIPNVCVRYIGIGHAEWMDTEAKERTFTIE